MMGAIFTITPLSPQGMRVYPAGKSLSPEGMRVYPTGKRLSPEGMRVCPTGKPLSPEGMRVYPTGKRLSPEGMAVYPQKNASTTIYNESLNVWAQLSEAFSQDFDQDRSGTTHETLHSDDHQYQAHESHHDVVAGLP